MGIDDLILSIITLILILLFMFNPLFRKLMKVFQGDTDEPPRGEDRMYESADSCRVVMNLTETAERPGGKKIVIREARSPAGKYPLKKDEYRRADAASRVPGKTSLKKAVVWKEILDPPRALKPFGDKELF